MSPRRIAVIGGGPAGLMAAEILGRAGLGVTVYDRMPSVGRKFLMAGRGGLNLTHSEPLADVLGRYQPAAPGLIAAIEAFDPKALRSWAACLGQATFVGSSGRVFPNAMKASPLLRAWLRRLTAQNVRVALRHEWRGWSDDGALTFDAPAGAVAVRPDATLLALGGASWPRLGADGGWAATLRQHGIAVTPLRPANVGFIVAWSPVFAARFAGAPLKTIALTFAGRRVRGEAVVTAAGIEGGAVYSLSAALREAVRDGPTVVEIDLKPDWSKAELTGRLARARPDQSLANLLRKAARLSPLAVNLLREGDAAPPRQPESLAAAIKATPLRLVAAQGLDRAISTAGGIAWDELDASFMLKLLPGTFAAGEMLDWEAPTGGYLLQACFATGAAAAEGVLRFLAVDAGS